MNRPSKRFASTKWVDYFVPAALILLALALAITLLLVILFVVGLL